MIYKINKEDKKIVENRLIDSGYKPKWMGNLLIVSDKLEDRIYDILCDYDIPFVKESEFT